MKKYYLFEMNIKSINILAVILLLILFIVTPIINPSYSMIDIDLGLFLITVIPYFILHEVIHSIAYVLWGADFKKITYGAHLEKGILCCLCKQNISKRNVLASLLAPLKNLVELWFNLLININSRNGIDFLLCKRKG